MKNTSSKKIQDTYTSSKKHKTHTYDKRLVEMVKSVEQFVVDVIKPEKKKQVLQISTDILVITTQWVCCIFFLFSEIIQWTHVLTWMYIRRSSDSQIDRYYACILFTWYFYKVTYPRVAISRINSFQPSVAIMKWNFSAETQFL